MNTSYSDIFLLIIGLGMLFYYIFFMIKKDIDLKTHSYVLEPNQTNDSDNSNDTVSKSSKSSKPSKSSTETETTD
jgi:hypothetical protein